MIFVDTNVFMYAVGRSHPLQEKARLFFGESLTSQQKLVTSSEVLQELLHVYLPVRRMTTLDAALALVDACISSIWVLEPEDVRLARDLADQSPALNARDLIHLACCKRRDIQTLKTFDRSLGDAAPLLLSRDA
ncbi:MAG TPA: type II toxin-antitoxin system VapC family toxin [Thermoanaerobaculia bacterium]|nr:type II toxin-antitoxin system VapC family toxin [Thermoanaerobaculia bacterium]